MATYAVQFEHILPAKFLDDISTSQRIRHYSNVIVFWAWLAQILEANASFTKAVSLVQAWCDDAGLPKPKSDTGAYSKARGRVELKFLKSIRERINSTIRQRIRPEDTYQGHVVKSIDGSSVALSDTEANQLKYPQPSGQKKGCGFPVMSVMGVLNHGSGAWEDFAVDKQTTHDAPLAHKLLHCFDKGDIACGDRAFGTYELKALLLQKGTHSLMRLHQARHRTFDKRKGKRIGKNERVVTWKKPTTQPKGSVLDKDSWKAVASELTVRLIWFNFTDRAGKKRQMVLTTTLLDSEKYKWSDLAALYLERWDIELRLRDVKTTLQMETFNVKTPEAAHKTLEMTLIAYNLIKLTMQEAAHEAGECHRLLSFKGALDTVVAFTTRYVRRQNHTRVTQDIWGSMIEVISEKLINLRPNRHEPRAIKRRPKGFSFLTSPRALYAESFHKGGYRSCA